MNRRDFYKMCLSIGAAPDSKDFMIRRCDFVTWMSEQGYADRTIRNHATPSREGGIINQLMADGLITVGGLKRWIVPSVQELNTERLAKEKKASVVKLFSGNTPEGNGWITSTRLDDENEEGVEWRLFRKEYAEGCNNLKVVALGKRVPHKANYWMTAKHGKVIMNKNSMLLKQHRPDIFDNLCEDLQDL